MTRCDVSKWRGRFQVALRVVAVAACVATIGSGCTAARSARPRSAGPVPPAVHARDHDHDDGDMDKPLSKAPEARFRSPERERQAKEADAQRAAQEAKNPTRLMARSINAGFRAFAAGDPIRVHALDVGAGACVVIECPGSTDVIVYDCGTLKRTRFDMTREKVKDYIASIVDDAEPMVMMSHAHADHVNLIPFVFGDVKVRSIWIGGQESDYGSDTDEEGAKADLHAWITGQVANGATLHHGFEAGFDNGGESVDELQCGDADTFVLTVNNEPAVGGNDNRRMHANNLTVLIRYGEFKVILTGDAVGETEAAAMSSYGALIGDTTLLFASHHGARSNASNSEEWVSAVRPAIIVYSADTMPSYGHPKGEIVERYRAVGSLKTTKPHRIWMDPTSESSAKEMTTVAEYVTELNGVVVVESDGTSKVSTTCSRSPDCW